jgi:hypothetical protein
VPAITVEKLIFSFPHGWQVSKYDDCSFYRNQFARQGDGIKAVDLIAISNETDAFLIEVKDYRHPSTKRKLPSELPEIIAGKVRNTLAAMLPARLNANDSAEKNFAASVLVCHSLKVVLHIEQKRHAIDPADIMQKLRGKLRAIDAHPKIVSMAQMQNLAWTVA